MRVNPLCPKNRSMQFSAYRLFPPLAKGARGDLTGGVGKLHAPVPKNRWSLWREIVDLVSTGGRGSVGVTTGQHARTRGGPPQRSSTGGSPRASSPYKTKRG